MATGGAAADAPAAGGVAVGAAAIGAVAAGAAATGAAGFAASRPPAVRALAGAGSFGKRGWLCEAAGDVGTTVIFSST